MQSFSQKMVDKTILAIVAIAAVMGLLGLVVVESINIPQQQQNQQAFAAGCQNGSHAFFQSKGNCFHPG
jgi:hypothetical protein